MRLQWMQIWWLAGVEMEQRRTNRFSFISTHTPSAQNYGGNPSSRRQIRSTIQFMHIVRKLMRENIEHSDNASMERERK